MPASNNPSFAMGWSAENYIAALLNMQRSKQGLHIPDLVSNEHWNQVFYIEVKEGRGKALIHPSQMFIDELIQQSIVEQGNHRIRDSKLYLNPPPTEVRAYFAFLDRLNNQENSPRERCETIALQLGDLYLVPTAIAKALYIQEIARRISNEIPMPEKEKLQEIMKALNMMKQGVLNHIPGRTIMHELSQAYEKGALKINPGCFGAKKNTLKEHELHPSRVETIKHSTLQLLYSQQGALWEQLKPLLPEEYTRLSIIKVYGPDNTHISLLDKDDALIPIIAAKAEQNTPGIESINLLRRVVHGLSKITADGYKLTPKGRMQFEARTWELIKELKRNRQLEILIASAHSDLLEWTLPAQEAQAIIGRIEQVIPLTRLERLLH